jgi:hypothetical protein
VHHSFVSYHRADAAWVRELVSRLDANGVPTWIDQRDIPVSFPWVSEVEDAIVDSDVFVVCDSPGRRRSANCAVEDDRANRANKRVCSVSVGASVDLSAAAVAEVTRSITSAESSRTELAALSRDWDRAGRPRSALVSAPSRRRLRQSLAVAPPASEIESSFLRASRSRSRRRLTGTLGVATIFGLAFLGQAVFSAARDRVDEQIRRQAASYVVGRAAAANTQRSAFLGLESASRLGGSEGAAYSFAVSTALKNQVPNDAFRVPSDAQRFVDRPVGDDVVVTTASGEAWHRAANAGTTRRAGRATPAALPPRAVAASGLVLRGTARSSEVNVLKRGALWRKVRFSKVPEHLRLSPDGRRIAGAVGSDVEIVDVDSGHLRTVLRGNERELLDVQWASDGRRVWALAHGRVVSWPLQTGRLLIDDPQTSIEAIIRSASRRAVWVARADGRLREVDVSNGAVLAEHRVPGPIRSGAGSPDGSVAAISGEKHEWLVSLTSHRPIRSVDIRSCTPGRPTFQNARLFYLPCLAGQLLVVSTSSGRVVQRVSIPLNGAYGAQAMPGARRVAVGEQLGRLYELRGSRLSQIVQSQCGAAAARVAVSPDGREVLPVGPGTGSVGCTRIGIAGADGGWTLNAVHDHSSASFSAGAATFSRTGRAFAIGYTDGTIVMHPSANLTPTVAVTSVDGSIRDMLTLPDGSLLVASDAGELHRIPWCETCLSDRYLAHVAKAKVARGRAVGVWRPHPHE